jgi:hypothetical protein
MSSTLVGIASVSAVSSNGSIDRRIFIDSILMNGLIYPIESNNKTQNAQGSQESICSQSGQR